MRFLDKIWKKKPILEQKEDIDYLKRLEFSIENLLSKLELIGISNQLGDNLQEKIKTNQKKLEEIKNKYSNNQEERIQYGVALSTFLDELTEFGKPYFYLENLDAFDYQEITVENFEEKKEEIKTLETEIMNYQKKKKNPLDMVEKDKKLSQLLEEKLVEVLFHFLRIELEVVGGKEFYSELSIDSQLLLEKKFLQKLSEKAAVDSEISQYLKENDIGTLSFDYNLLEKVMDEKKEESALSEKREIPLYSFHISTKKFIELNQEFFHLTLEYVSTIRLKDDPVKLKIQGVSRNKKLNSKIKDAYLIEKSFQKSETEDSYFYVLMVSDKKEGKRPIVIGTVEVIEENLFQKKPTCILLRLMKIRQSEYNQLEYCLAKYQNTKFEELAEYFIDMYQNIFQLIPIYKKLDNRERFAPDFAEVKNKYNQVDNYPPKLKKYILK